MRWRKKTLNEIGGQITQLGLNECPVCKSPETIYADRRPVLLNVGGWPHEPSDPRHDPEANVLFMVRLVCRLCGYNVLFDSEQFRHGDEQTIFVGPEELEEKLDPPEAT